MKIIDEFTGRILDGRRWSEGLHQAVEAKEGVRIQEENQTLATITLQNYFRMYKKLAGMTGTALTEATEFMKIYKLPGRPDPDEPPDGPHGPERPGLQDQGRQVGGRRAGDRGAPRHRQPVLVGTISVEVSELLSGAAHKRGIPHTVLNAKPEHASARARSSPRPGGPAPSRSPPTWPAAAWTSSSAATPSTSRSSSWRSWACARATPTTTSATPTSCRPSTRAWRRTASRSCEAGGLFICGTERHESRRIDNQLRGRAGRQGDPGESRFFLSAEDELVRLFAGDRIYRILDRLGPVSEEGEEEPIEAKMLSKQIENAQRKVEEQNFLIRKRVLEYDDVMNQQREIVYQYRDGCSRARTWRRRARAGRRGASSG